MMVLDDEVGQGWSWSGLKKWYGLAARLTRPIGKLSPKPDACPAHWRQAHIADHPAVTIGQDFRDEANARRRRVEPLLEAATLPTWSANNHSQT